MFGYVSDGCVMERSPSFLSDYGMVTESCFSFVCLVEEKWNHNEGVYLIAVETCDEYDDQERESDSVRTVSGLCEGVCGVSLGRMIFAVMILCCTTSRHQGREKKYHHTLVL